MPLLALPQELKDEIIGIYVLNENVKKAARARQVCRDFNNIIPQEMLRQAASFDLDDIRSSRAYKLYFRQHIAGILCRKVWRKGTGKGRFLKFLETLVENAVEREWPLDTDAYDTLRSRYTRNICDALAGVRYKFMDELLTDTKSTDPKSIEALRAVTAAATGNVQLFLNNIDTIEDVLKRPFSHFPSALSAAVAANQTEMVDLILKWVLATVKGPWDTYKGDWKEMTTTASGVFEALRVAIRSRNDTIANTVFQVLTRESALGKSLHEDAGKWLMDDCARYGNVQCFLPALYYKRHQSWPVEDVNEQLRSYEAQEMLERCSQGWLHRLLVTEASKANYANHAQIMLTAAGYARRTDLELVLLAYLPKPKRRQDLI